MNKLVVSLIIISLLMSLSFLGGADLLMHQFCSASDVGGLCGMMRSISGALAHLSSIQTILMFLPVLFVILLLTYRLLSNYAHTFKLAQSSYSQTYPLIVSYGEWSWLAYRINGPNI